MGDKVNKSEWMELSPENVALVQGCGPDERVMVYGDRWVKLPIDHMLAILKTAFNEAYVAAFNQADPAERDHLEVSLDDQAFGQTYFTVRLRDRNGRETSGIGHFPNPDIH